MPKKKTVSEPLPESQDLLAEQAEMADVPSEMIPESAGAEAVPGQIEMLAGAEPLAGALSESEPDAAGLPIGDGYPAGESPDIVSVEFEAGVDDGAVPAEPGADVPYGEESPDDPVSEPKPELTVPAEQPSGPAPAAPPPDAPVDERRAFFGQDFRELDRGLTPEQRQEWNSIYASYRGRSVMSGKVIGVDRVRLRTRDKKTGEMIWQRMNCAVVIPFRVRVLIPESEMWMPGDERPGYVLRNISDSIIDFVIISVDRENGLAFGSRRMALPSRRYFFSTQPDLNRPGARISCNVLAVGPRRCLVSCHGYDLDLTQREMSYTAVADLREEYHTGEPLDCIVKEYDRRKNRLVISVKETVPNPFDGADFRHPEGSQRCAVIAGKYAGGVFCNLPDGVTVMCNYAFHYDDSTFKSGDRVRLVIQRYDMGKKQIYGKIVAKI